MDRTGGRAKRRMKRIRRPSRRSIYSNGRINALVCMFNSFALARPFCERMKIAVLGSSAAGFGSAS